MDNSKTSFLLGKYGQIIGKWVIFRSHGKQNIVGISVYVLVVMKNKNISVMVISLAFVSDIVLVRLCMNRYAMCIVYSYIYIRISMYTYIFRTVCIYTHSVDMTEKKVVNTIQKASI